MKLPRNWPYSSYPKREQLMAWLLLFLYFDLLLLSVVRGKEAQVKLKNEELQDRFREMFDWRESVAEGTTLVVNVAQRQVLSQVSETISKGEFFFGLNPTHIHAISSLKNVLMDQESPTDWLEMASGLRDQLNPHVWLSAVFSSAMHRKDLQSFRLPHVVEVMPSMFIEREILERMIQSVPNQTCVKVDESFGRDNGAENALWYFREDVMLNSHHWFWHLSYPIFGKEVKQPDRNGELFYFMHHDFLARYHSERLSAGLLPIQQWNVEVGAVIPFGYNPHLHDGNSGMNWSARPPNIPVSDTSGDNALGAPPIDIKLRTIQKNRILDGISKGSLNGSNGQPIPLDSTTGITLLGNVIQANKYSVNPDFYGWFGIHNDGHIVVSFAVDPRNERGTPPGVMGETGTSMRDVMFYPYHIEIDSIFKAYKDTLPSYQLKEGEWPLLLEGVTINSLKVQSRNLPVSNELHTFWNSKTFDLSRGLDFQRNLTDNNTGPLLICEKILYHKDFQYELEIEQALSADEIYEVTVRLFMGPRYDLYGRRYTMEEERDLMFILDTFPAQIHPGLNIVRRDSKATPLTIDFNQGLDELGDKNVKPFCGCGWPQHLLIPKGNQKGLAFDLFAIVTNGEDDKVEQQSERDEGEDNEPCQPAYVYCGLMGKNYPDARPMGYPFDRKLYISDMEATLDKLVEDVANAAMALVKIVHFD